MKTLTCTWTGIRPLIMHNGLMADPTNAAVRAIREITKKGTKKLTDADYEERDRLEWDGSLYWDDVEGPFIPSDNLERCIQLGAQKSRIGKDVAAAVLVDGFVPLQYDGPRTKEELYADSRFTLRKGVKIQQSRIIRIRPRFQTWSVSFSLNYDAHILNEANLMKAMVDAGDLIGLGDHRPKYGRFEVS